MALVVVLGLPRPGVTANLVVNEALGLRVERGFRVSLYADADLANDVYAMTLDAKGNVVITSQGYIKTLLDRRSAGFADSAVPFAGTPTGGMGLCFDGSDLYFVGDGWLSRYPDSNADGVADGAPQKIIPLDFFEHGGHAVRKGPDGWWYVIAGNETHFTNEHVTLANSPVRAVEGGALLRVSADGRNCEVVAHGFRNPYDFDFNWLGDVFTYDSDCERDLFLPWYTPTRLYHIGYGAHHGWRLEGWLRSWARPDYYADTVDVLYPIGRGSPTGLTCYRHSQFPTRYRNGLFFLDWTFGRVYFTPLQPSGSSYQVAPEVFMEPIGTHGFAPTDVAVAKDGSLLISIGGRKTRGSVYRVEYVAEGNRTFIASNWWLTATSELEAVLNSPQPLEAWSRAYWEPRAIQLGPRPFAAVVTDNRREPAVRVRAVEILTALHGGLADATAAAGAQAGSSFVRARVAWSLGRAPAENSAVILSGLALDADPVVRRCALESLADHANELEPLLLEQSIAANLAHPDKRVRLVTARLATLLPATAWRSFWVQQQKAASQARLTLAMALLWRDPGIAVNLPAIETALAVLAQSKIPDERLQAIRLIILAMGDYHLRNPSIEAYTAYEPANSLQGYEGMQIRVRKAVEAVLPSGVPVVDFEAARLLAMLEDNDPGLPRKIVSFFNDTSSPTADFHYLTVLSRLKAPLPTNAIARVANTILSLDRKLEGLQARPQQTWTTRLGEVVQALVRQNPALAQALLRHRDFAKPDHVFLANSLGVQNVLVAARRFEEALRSQPNFVWSGSLIELLAILPGEETRPLLRKQWSNVALRDELLLHLARQPEMSDRDKFIAGLESPQAQVARASMSALLQLPPEPSGKALVPAMRLLRRLLNETMENAARAQALLLVSRESGQTFKIQEEGIDDASLKRAYQPVFDWFSQRYPALVRLLNADGSENAAVWNLKLKSVVWELGNAGRGEAIFRERGCQTCHAGTTPLGPDLGGVAARFSVTDLFSAILFPSRDVAPPYRTTVFHMRDGGSYSGIVAFESADGVILRTGAATTVRLAENEILSRLPGSQSLMPDGLLNGLSSQDLGDLYAYLKVLEPSDH